MVSKTPGGQAASDKFAKQQAQSMTAQHDEFYMSANTTKHMALAQRMHLVTPSPRALVRHQ